MVPRWLILGCVALSGCATVPPPMVERDDLSTMRPDCTNAAVQVRWLEHQLAAGGYDPERSDYERRYVANAKNLIWTIKSTCVQPVSSRRRR